MTSAPYAGGYNDAFLPPMPERTSGVAIAALVFGVLSVVACCVMVPGLGFVAAVLAVFALVAIGASRGALGGRVMAITGLMLGLVADLAKIGALVLISQGIAMVGTELGGKTTRLFAAAQAGDAGAVRAELLPASAEKLSDEAIAAFSAETAGLGAVREVPTTPIAYLRMMGEAGPLLESMVGSQSTVPLPVRFEQGMGLMLFDMPTSPASGAGGAGGSGGAFPVMVIRVVTPEGWVIELGKPGEPTRLPSFEKNPAAPTPVLPGGAGPAGAGETGETGETGGAGGEPAGDGTGGG